MRRRDDSTQARYLRLAAIGKHWVTFEEGHACAALEVAGIPFRLRSDEEQEDVVAGYAGFLQGLEHPVQILVRVLPMDLQGYLADLERRSRLLPETLATFARAHRAFLANLAKQRQLLERHHYVVVSTEPPAPSVRLPWPWRRRPTATRDQVGAEAALVARLDSLAEGLRRADLDARRLGGKELALLLHACWCPELARQQRLATDLDEALPTASSVSTEERRYR